MRNGTRQRIVRDCALVALLLILIATGCRARAQPETAPDAGRVPDPPAEAAPDEPNTDFSEVEPIDEPAPKLLPDEGGQDEAAILDTLAETEKLLALLGGRILTVEQGEQVTAVRAFVAQAREALTGEELQRASVLSEKAVVLARDVESVSHE